jgi:hypothetical protein
MVWGANAWGTSLILTKLWPENLKGRHHTDNKRNPEGIETNFKVLGYEEMFMSQTNYQELATKKKIKTSL